MLRAIRNIFESAFPDSAGESREDPGRALQLATAALFVELSRSDFEVQEEERRVAQRALERVLGLAKEEASRLLERAEEKAEETVSLFEFTDLVHRNCPPEQKIEIVERLWRLAFADGRLDHHEEHMMRKIQRLLHIPQKDFIAAKQRARAATVAG